MTTPAKGRCAAGQAVQGLHEAALLQVLLQHPGHGTAVASTAGELHITGWACARGHCKRDPEGSKRCFPNGVFSDSSP